MRGIFPWKKVSNCWQLHSSQEKLPSSTCMQKSEKPFRPQGEVSWEGGMTTFLGGKYDIQLEKENNPCTMKSLIYLWAATVAAASKANCRITLSSRYFCSHLVMSASRARILSSFSRRSSISAVALYSETLAAWDVPWRWLPKEKKKSQDASVRLRVGFFAFCLKDRGWSRAALVGHKNPAGWKAVAYAMLGRLGDGNDLLKSLIWNICRGTSASLCQNQETSSYNARKAPSLFQVLKLKSHKTPSTAPKKA